MADTHTDRLGLIQMEEGTHSNEWGDMLNLVIGRLDAAARGFKEIVITGPQTLDANDITTTASIAEEEAFFQWIEFTGTPGVTTAVTVQAEEMTWNVYNNTDSIINFTPTGGTLTALAVGQAYTLVYIAADTAFTDMTAAVIHTASNITIVDAGSYLTATDVEGALQEIAVDTRFLTVTQAVNLDTMESDIAANTAKTSNAVHTGDVTGGTALTLAATQAALTTAVNLTSVGKLTSLITDGNILMDEETDVSAPGAGNGRWWVKGGIAPNVPMFTDDTDVDHNIVTADVALKSKVIEIGDWDMDANFSKAILHGLTAANIRGLSALIRSDDASFLNDMNVTDGSSGGLNGTYISTTTIVLARETGGHFDKTTYNATSYNRGWVTLWYV